VGSETLKPLQVVDPAGLLPSAASTTTLCGISCPDRTVSVGSVPKFGHGVTCIGASPRGSPSSRRWTRTSMPGCATSGMSTCVAVAMPCRRRSSRMRDSRDANDPGSRNCSGSGP
jgi:hypothetical protein